MTKLSHLNEKGEARMVDVSDKAVTQRTARAEGFVAMAPATLALVEKRHRQEGRRAGHRAHRRHHGREEDARADPAVPSAGHHQGRPSSSRPRASPPASRVTAEVKVAGQTGVEMEALTAVSVACLTIYDMLKAADKAMVLGDIRLVEKTGGRSGTYRAEARAVSLIAHLSSRPERAARRAGTQEPSAPMHRCWLRIVAAQRPG